MSDKLYEEELEYIPPKKRARRKQVRLNFSSKEAFEKSAARFYESLSPENLEKQVMVVSIYYYVPGITKEGKRVFLGPYMTLREADSALAKLDDGYIYESKSRDLAKATGEWKADQISKGVDVDKAIKSISHKVKS